MRITEEDIYTVTCPDDKTMWKCITPDMLDSIAVMFPFAVRSLEMVKILHGETSNYFYYDSACNCYLFYVPPDEAGVLKLRSQINTAEPDYIVLPYFKVFERWLASYDNVVLLTPF